MSSLDGAFSQQIQRDKLSRAWLFPWMSGSQRSPGNTHSVETVCLFGIIRGIPLVSCTGKRRTHGWFVSSRRWSGSISVVEQVQPSFFACVIACFEQLVLQSRDPVSSLCSCCLCLLSLVFMCLCPRVFLLINRSS